MFELVVVMCVLVVGWLPVCTHPRTQISGGMSDVWCVNVGNVCGVSSVECQVWCVRRRSVSTCMSTVSCASADIV